MVNPSIHTFWLLKLLNGGTRMSTGRATATSAMPTRIVSER